MTFQTIASANPSSGGIIISSFDMSSGYCCPELLISGLVVSTDDTELFARFHVNGSVVTSSVYRYSMATVAVDGVVRVDDKNTFPYIRLTSSWAAWGIGNSSGELYSGRLRMGNCLEANGKRKHLYAETQHIFPSATVGDNVISGSCASSGQVTGIELYTDVGSILSGKLTVIAVPLFNDVDSFWEHVAFYASMTGVNSSTTWTDVGTLGKTITRNGNIAISDVIPYVAANPNIPYNTTYFDGTGDYLTATDDAVISAANNDDICLEAWVRTNAAGVTQTIFGKRDGSGAEEFTLSLTSNSNFLQMDAFASGSAILSFNSSVAVVSGYWYHVATQRDGGARWRLWVNGDLQGVGSESAQPSDNAAPFYIGRNAFNTSRDWRGAMIGVRVTKAVRYDTSSFAPPSFPLPTRGP